MEEKEHDQKEGGTCFALTGGRRADRKFSSKGTHFRLGSGQYLGRPSSLKNRTFNAHTFPVGIGGLVKNEKAGQASVRKRKKLYKGSLKEHMAR